MSLRAHARQIGLRQSTVARLLRRTEQYVSRRIGGPVPPGDIEFAVIAWQIMTPPQRIDFLAARGMLPGPRTRQRVLMGRPKKDGARKPCGRLKQNRPDAGHDLVLQRRAETVGAANARDPRAAWSLGRLAIAGALADPGVDPRSEQGREQTTRRYDA